MILSGKDDMHPPSPVSIRIMAAVSDLFRLFNKSRNLWENVDESLHLLAVLFEVPQIALYRKHYTRKNN
jgi:hypothetical protein